MERITSDAERVNKTLEQLQQLADLPVLPRRMESYDISHTAGQDMVASMVVFADGKPLKRDYRRFQIKSLDHADDLRALQEVLQRRMQRYLDGDEHFSPLPDLLLMDGGHLQAQATQQQLESMGIHVPILGMVKDDRHRTRALVTPEGRELGIQQSPPLFALVGRVQEEVHRFAITYHHEKHSRSAMTSRLDGIPGIGDVRKKALLKHFKSVKAISQAELVQLEALLPKAAARAVYDHFHEKNTWKGEARPFWPGLSFHRIQAEAPAAALKFHQIQPRLRIEPALHRAVHDLQHQLTGGADDRLVQVSAQHTTLRVPGAHVEVGVKLPVSGGDGPHQRDDLKIPLKAVGMVLLLRRVEHPHSEVPHGAQPLTAANRMFSCSAARRSWVSTSSPRSIRSTMRLPKRLYSIRPILSLIGQIAIPQTLLLLPRGLLRDAPQLRRRLREEHVRPAVGVDLGHVQPAGKRAAAGDTPALRR